MRRIKGLWASIFLALLLLWPVSLPAEVISVEQKDLYAAYFFVPEGSPTTLPYVFTKFGPGNLNFLERVDIVQDQEGRVAGVVLVYTPSDGFKRHVFLKGISGWMFEEIRPGSQGKRVTIRVITSQDLNKVD